MIRTVFLLSGLAFALLASVSPAIDAREPIERRDTNGTEPVVVDDPAFPAPVPKKPVQLYTGTFYAPPTDFNGVDLGLVRVNLRGRARIPIDDTINFQVLADFRANLYDADSHAALFADCADCPTPDELYSGALAAQVGVLLNRDRHLFRAGERWAALGSLYGRARWEPGAFEQSLTPGLLLGIGYQLPGSLSIALAGRVEESLDGDGVRLKPSGNLRWDFAPQWRLRNRGLGLQLEYEPTDRIEVFVAGFRMVDRYLLEDRRGLTSAPTFRDRQVLVGGGLTYEISRTVELTGEAGAIVDRRLSVDTRDDGRLDSTDGDLSPYVAIRAEIRP